jgi:hypothetical protein
MSGQHARIFRIALIGVYIAIPFLLAFGTYRGWLFQSGSSNSSAAGGGLLALVMATMLGESAGIFGRAAGGRDVVIAIACWLGAVVWAVAVVRLVPDSHLGPTVLIGPLSALMLGGVFHLSRFLGMLTRFLTGAFMTAVPMPLAPTISGGLSLQETPGHRDESHQGDRIDIAADNGRIALRLLGGAAASLVVAQVMRSAGSDAFAPVLICLAAALLGLLALRSLPRRAPALSLDSCGISIRADLCSIRGLPWTEITGFEVKSSIAYTFLVIRVRDAEALIAQRGPFTRFLMNQSLVMFGSPVRIPLAWLKCDPGWLLHKANEMRGNRPPATPYKDSP